MVGAMTAHSREPLLVAIVGPTASGKTALAIALAERCGGEIISCDSVAVYREFNLGTAKPTPEERAPVPHHLIDIAEPRQHFTAGDYARAARASVAEIGRRGRLPIVVGGTGLYLRALLDGLFAGPPRSEALRARLRAAAQARGSAYLHRMLRRLDATAAAKIHPNDEPKLVRALEVCFSARRPLTELWQEGRDPLRGFRVLRLGLAPPRDALYARINGRARAMFDAGLIEETRSLRERYGDAAWALGSLGYAQALRHLRGELTLEQAITAAQQTHRNYAKRQMTWFRREPEVHWIAGFGDEASVQREAADVVAAQG
jgi:tRNA dimethylallyltransferase